MCVYIFTYLSIYLYLSMHFFCFFDINIYSMYPSRSYHFQVISFDVGRWHIFLCHVFSASHGMCVDCWDVLVCFKCMTCSNLCSPFFNNAPPLPHLPGNGCKRSRSSAGTRRIIVIVIFLLVKVPSHVAISNQIYVRRKFRNQTSDNMQRWKSRGGKSQRGEVKK